MNQATFFNTPTKPAGRVAGDELFPEEAVTCRACGAVFVDLSNKRLCDVCLVDRVNGAGELELDDPDDIINQTAPLRIPELCAIVCVVCNLPIKIPIDAPARLCHACSADLVMTRNHVEMALAGARANHERAVDDWATALAAADPATLARWDKAESYIKSGREGDAAFRATWERERATETPLGAILRAYERYTAAERATTELRAWAGRAIAEIESAEASHADG